MGMHCKETQDESEIAHARIRLEQGEDREQDMRHRMRSSVHSIGYWHEINEWVGMQYE